MKNKYSCFIYIIIVLQYSFINGKNSDILDYVDAKFKDDITVKKQVARAYIGLEQTDKGVEYIGKLKISESERLDLFIDIIKRLSENDIEKIELEKKIENLDGNERADYVNLLIRKRI
jgi:hypothetical protein